MKTTIKDNVLHIEIPLHAPRPSATGKTFMFGIVPTGLDSFECTPWLPKDWPRMALRDVRAFGQSWDLVVERAGDQQKVTVLSGGKTLMTGLGPVGKTYSLTFPDGKNETQKE